MPNKGGTITIKEIITKDALYWGDTYTKEVGKAIKVNEQFIGELKELASIYPQLTKAQKESTYLATKEKEVKLTKAVTSSYKAQQAQINTLVKTKAKLLNASNKEARETAKIRVEQNKLNRLHRESAILTNKLVGAYQKLNLRRTRAKKTVQDLIAQGKRANQTQAQYNSTLKRAQARFDNYSARVKKADRATRDFHKNVGNYKSALGGALPMLRSFTAALGLMGGAFLFITVIRDTIRRIREFDKTMVGLSAILETTRKDLIGLEKEITRVAGASIKTSNEVAKLATKLATLGKTKSEITDLLEPVNNLAIGLEATSDEAGELLVTTLNAFGESTKEAQRYADVVAKMRTTTALDFQRIRDALSYISPVAKTAGLSIENVGAMLGTLVDGGEKAEKAGRLLRTSILKLAKEGLSLEDALDKINIAQSKQVTNLELLTIAGDLFGKQSASIGIILANNRDKVARLTAEYEKSAGALEELVDKQLESLDAKLRILDSSYEKLILTVESGEGSIGNFFKTAIEGATNFLKKLTEINETTALMVELGISKDKGWLKIFGLGFLDMAKNIGEVSGTLVNLNKDFDYMRDKSVEAIETEAQWAWEMALRFEKNSAEAKIWRWQNQRLLDLAKAKNEAIKEEVKEKKKLIEVEKKITKEKKEQKKEEIKGLLIGSEDWLKYMISSLQKMQSATTTTRKEWVEFERQINEVKEALKELKGIGDIEPISDEEFNKFKHLAKFFEDTLTDDEIAGLKKEDWQERVDIAKEAISEIANLVNTVFDGRIMRIEEEMQANEDFYASQMILADEDSEQQNLLEQERFIKQEELRKKKLIEQQKQAKYEKAFSVMQIGLNIAVEISKVLGKPWQIALVAALGAVQLATALATPIPKYKEGTDNHKGGLAIVGDGGRSEVIQRPGMPAYLSPNKDTLTYLEKGSKVYKSEDDYYNRILRSTILANVEVGREPKQDLSKEIRKGFKGIKSNIILKQNFDYLRYKNNNLQW